MITIACVYWKGKFRGREKLYSVRWVKRLRNMVSRNLPIPHRFVCLSNVEVPCERIPLLHNWPGYWSKIELFRPGIFEDRVLYLDLDLVVLESLIPLINYSSTPFTIMAKKQHGTKHKEGKIIITKYNSSVMVFDPGAADKLYEKLDEKVIEKYWGDQDYIADRLPLLDTFPLRWIQKLKDCPNGIPNKDMKIALCMLGRDKPGKNIQAAKEYKWVKELWI